jgi:hypothetical protein
MNCPQQIALALSENNKPLTVQGFYTLAMGMHTEAHSPVFMGEGLQPSFSLSEFHAIHRD